MDLATAFGAVNWLSVCLAALSAFMIGGLWYGPLFGRAWMQAWGFSEDALAARGLAQTFGGALALALLAAFTLEMFIGADATAGTGALGGLLAGVGWVGAFLGILYLFEMRALKLWAINAGYCAVSLATMGAVLGAM